MYTKCFFKFLLIIWVGFVLADPALGNSDNQSKLRSLCQSSLLKLSESVASSPFAETQERIQLTGVNSPVKAAAKPLEMATTIALLNSKFSDPKPLENGLEITYYNSPEGRSRLLAMMMAKNTAQEEAQRTFLANNEILKYRKGGMGFTFTAKDNRTQKIYRYKGSLRKNWKGNKTTPSLELNTNGIPTFAQEALLTILAGKAPIGPKTEFDPNTGLLKMEEISGMNLEEFNTEVLPNMSPIEREQWLTHFTLSMIEKLQRSHNLGILHLDLKPNNIMIPTENESGRNIFLIDFGLALSATQLAEVYQALGGNPYGGSPHYQGRSSTSGKPNYSDDYEALSIVLSEMSDSNFLSQRPGLLSLLDIFGGRVPHSVSSSTTLSDSQLLTMALDKTLSEADQARFWEALYLKFKEYHPEQQQNILKLNPELVIKFSEFL